jgi:hypothetical protein
VVFTPNSRLSKKTEPRNLLSEIASIDGSFRPPLTADLQLDVDIGTLSNGSHDVTHQFVSLAQDGIHQGSHSDKTSRNGKLKIVALGEERDNPGSKGLTDEFTSLVGKYLSGSDLDFLSDLEHSAQDTSSRYSSLQLVYRGTWLVDIERSNNDQSRVGLEIMFGNGDFGTDVLIDSVDVVFQLGRDRDDRGVSGNSS